MNAEMHDFEWLDLHGTIGAPELGRMCGLSVADVRELLEYGLLTPLADTGEGPIFSTACVPPLRQAARLRARFDLDLFVLGLMFSQMEQIAQLERQVRALQAQLPHELPERDGPARWREPHG
ncbi:MAG: chaperone modulator CbpM [Ramlibacter sp.]